MSKHQRGNREAKQPKRLPVPADAPAPPAKPGPSSRSAWALAAVVATLGWAPLSAHAAATAAEQARYQRERATCLEGRSNQDRATCLKEAEAAFAEIQKGKLTNDPDSYARNARQRCNGLPGDQRQACLARMEGQGTTSGSVASGGILRELVTQEPAASGPAAPASGGARNVSGVKAVKNQISVQP